MQVCQILHCSFVIDQPHQSLFANHKNYLCFTLIRDAISLARPSSLRKEGKSAVLDYWQFKVLHSALICFTNPASPNFFTGRAGFVLRTHTAHLPKSALGLLAFTRLSISLQIFILKIFHFINLVHMGTGCYAHGVPAQNPQKKLRETLSIYCIYSN